MKKTSLVLSMALVCLIFTQCKKQIHSDQSAEKPRTVTSMAEANSTGAQFMCNDCQESGTKVTGTQAQTLANTFAPKLMFDQAAPDYPTSVENVWANTDQNSIVCNGQLVLINRDAPRSKDFPTYYEVQRHPNDANRVFIDYWWTYKSQTTCFLNQGGHDYDWEHTVIQVNTQTNRVISVTYFQHSGWYTRDWRNVAANTRVQIFVGKKAHGSYYNRNTISFPGYDCSYYGDYRNPNGAGDEVLSGNNLVGMNCNMSHFSFNGGWGTIGKGPLFRYRAYWDFDACNGSAGLFGTDGCSNCNFGSSVKIGNIS